MTQIKHGTIILPNGDELSVITDIITRLSGRFVKTYIPNSGLGLKCRVNKVSYINLNIFDDRIYIEGFYVYPQTSDCAFKPDERKLYQGIGELMFNIAFKVSLKNFFSNKDPSQIYVSAEVAGGLVGSKRTSDCQLLDKIYWKKYGFREVNLCDKGYNELADEHISQCYQLLTENEYCSIMIRTKLSDILSQLTKLEEKAKYRL